MTHIDYAFIICDAHRFKDYHALERRFLKEMKSEDISHRAHRIRGAEFGPEGGCTAYFFRLPDCVDEVAASYVGMGKAFENGWTFEDTYGTLVKL